MYKSAYWNLITGRKDNDKDKNEEQPISAQHVLAECQVSFDQPGREKSESVRACLISVAISFKKTTATAIVAAAATVAA